MTEPITGVCLPCFVGHHDICARPDNCECWFGPCWDRIAPDGVEIGPEAQ